MRALWVVVTILLVLTAGAARGAPSPDRLAFLQRGINLTGWFRFPASLDPAALHRWIGDEALAGLHRAGFGFLRLAVDPVVLSAPGVPAALQQAIRRIEHAGLAVVVSVHPVGWHLESDPADQDRLFAGWRVLDRLLAPLDPERTVPELLNEPVFRNDPAGWQTLQHRLLLEIRRTLPHHTVLLTGNDWGSVAGLVTMTPEADPNILYSVHLYEPAELTSLAAWRPGLDRLALARLPFPATDEAACQATVSHTDRDTTGVMLFYCSQRWNAGRIAAKLEDAARWGHDHAIPILLGEFGASASLNASARLAWLQTVRQAAERCGMGWALWGYDDVMGLNVPRPPGPGRPLDAAVLAALGLTR